MTNLLTKRNARDISLRRETSNPVERRRKGGEEGVVLAGIAVEAALDKKALEPLLLNVGKLCSYTDYILLLSARSDRQVGAISEAIGQAMKAREHYPLGTEGQQAGQWALLDYGELIVHVFHHPVREFYDLESLWVDAPRVELDVPAEARVRADQPIY